MKSSDAIQKVEELQAELDVMLVSFAYLKQEANQAWQGSVQALLEAGHYVKAANAAERIQRCYAHKVRRTANRLYDQAKSGLAEITDQAFIDLMTVHWRKVERTHCEGNFVLLAVQVRWILDRLDEYNATSHHAR